jgi:hypothetical protein
MATRTEGEAAVILAFLEPYFGGGFQPGKVNRAEAGAINRILTYVRDHFGGMRYILGLALDFTLLAQRLAIHDPEAKRFRADLTKEALFLRYPRITQRGSRQANTLTVQFEDRSHKIQVKEGIRAIEEAVGDLFNDLNRTGYPSAYVYNTGQWHKYQDELLLPCFQLSDSGRFVLCQDLIDLGLALPVNRFFGRSVPRVRLFPEIVDHYPRSTAGENAGVAFQAIAYGYVKADRPHLSLIADKVRTGSARQEAPGRRRRLLRCGLGDVGRSEGWTDYGGKRRIRAGHLPEKGGVASNPRPGVRRVDRRGSGGPVEFGERGAVHRGRPPQDDPDVGLAQAGHGGARDAAPPLSRREGS